MLRSIIFISIVGLILLYIEQGCEYALVFGDMWEQFYATLEEYYDKAMRFVFLKVLLASYYEWIEKIIDGVSDCAVKWWVCEAVTEMLRQCNLCVIMVENYRDNFAATKIK